MHVRYAAISAQFFAKNIVNAADGGLVTVGGYNNGTATNDGLIFKTDIQKNIVWAKQFSFPGYTNPEIQKISAFSDNSVVIGGTIQNASATEHKIALLKIAGNGQITWSRIYEQSAAFSKSDILSVFSITEAAGGDILAAFNGIHYETNLDSSYAVTLRLNPTGIPLWSKTFVSNGNGDFTNPSGAFFKNNAVFVFGQVTDYYALNPCNGTGIFFGMKLDYATGNLADIKTYCYAEPGNSNSGGFGAPNEAFGAIALNNGNFSLFGRFYYFSTDQKTLYYDIEITDQLKIIKSDMLSANKTLTTGGYKFNVFSDAFKGLSGINTATGNIYWSVLDNNNIIIAEKIIAGTTLFSGSEPRIIRRGVNKTIISLNQKQNPLQYIDQYELEDKAPEISTCAGTDTKQISVSTFTTPNEQQWAWQSVIDNTVISNTQAVTIADINIAKLEICKEINQCTDIKISAAIDTVCILPSVPVQYKASRNPGCRQKVNWYLDKPVYDSIKIVNDTTVNIYFKYQPSDSTGFRQAKLYATAGNCNSIIDSAVITTVPFFPRISYDSIICAGTPVKLSPGHWFKSYKWQDGSTDSILIVNQPGTYTVQLTSFCGNTQYYAYHTKSINFSLGADMSLCKGDTAKIKAPAGFLNYNWQPTAYLQQINDSTVKIFNPHSQNFFAEAIHSSGCKVSDTINVKVISGPSNFLPIDTSVCTQQMIELKSNSNFKSYLWSGGETSKSIFINKPGLYSVKVTEENSNCMGIDTIVVLEKTCTNKIFFPSAFSPNADGLNDLFKPFAGGALENYELRVYNRWGQLVFKTNIYTDGWDGLLKSKMQTGAFVWICNYKFIGQEKEILKGSVLLLR